jgi:hypothetical protein
VEVGDVIHSGNVFLSALKNIAFSKGCQLAMFCESLLVIALAESDSAEQGVLVERCRFGDI